MYRYPFLFCWLWLTGSKQRLTILLCFGPLPLLPPSQHTEGEVMPLLAAERSGARQYRGQGITPQRGLMDWRQQRQPAAQNEVNGQSLFTAR